MSWRRNNPDGRTRRQALWAALRAVPWGALRVALEDAVALAGVGLCGFGAWQVYQPAGYVVAGGLLLWLVVAPRTRPDAANVVRPTDDGRPGR